MWFKKVSSLLVVIFLCQVVAFPAIAEEDNALFKQEIQQGKARQISTQSYTASKDGTTVFLNSQELKNYKLGPGDKIKINLVIGNNDLTLNYDYVILPSGYIYFANYGNILLNGLTVSDAEKLITRKLRNVYPKKIKVFMELQEAKTIRVYVLGQTSSPGIYSLSAAMHVSEITRAVGGVALGGSSRFVILARDNKEKAIDLYKISYKAETEDDVLIQSGDKIIIPIKGNAVTLMGAIPRPGTYEIAKGETLLSLLRMTGMVAPNSTLDKVVYLKRKFGEEKFEEYELNLVGVLENKSSAQNIVLENADIISIPAIDTYVYVYGEVAKPGRYSFIPGYTVADYVNLAGGPTPSAVLGTVTLTHPEYGTGKKSNYRVDLYSVLRLGEKDKDRGVSTGDIINVPGNFFYFKDFASFANTILLGLTLYTAVRSFR